MSPAPVRIILALEEEEDQPMADVKASAPTLQEATKHLRAAEREFDLAQERLDRARRQHAHAERPRLDDVRTSLMEAGLVARCPETMAPHDDVVRRLLSALAHRGLEIVETRR